MSVEVIIVSYENNLFHRCITSNNADPSDTEVEALPIGLSPTTKTKVSCRFVLCVLATV